jgi:acyl-CoA thioester hydrolase
MTAPLTHPLRVRYAECDPQGVVFNAHYLAWFDLNMTELWRAAFGSYQSAIDRGVDIVVVTAQLAYRASARFDDALELEVAVAALGTTSLTTEHAVRRDGQPLVTGTLRHVMVDPQALTKLAIPDWVRDGLAPWTLAEATAP